MFTTPIFLFLFLPVLLALHAAAPGRARNALLLGASLLFYAWGEGAFTLVMLFSIAVNHRFGLWLGEPDQRYHRALLAIALVVNLGLLGLFKYAGFIGANLALLGLPITVEPVHMPIGISFFTFHAISYLIDIHRGKAQARRSMIDFALYIALFPQLVAGPIVRYHQLEHQLGRRTVTLEGFAAGVRRFIFGLGKKMLIANAVAGTANEIFKLDPGSLTAGVAWLGALAYTAQIYFDFSGYSDMAIGLAAMFGFRFPENFDYPYIARSMTGFWRRWHITLSSWFRDYLYIPLGGNRRGRAREARNLVLVFFLCGLWHGASWTFVVWGLYHGGFLVLERGLRDRPWLRAVRPLGHVYALLAIVVGWVIFRAPDLPRALGMLRAMAGLGAARALALPALPGLPGLHDRGVVLALLLAAIFSCPVLPWLAARRPLAFPRLGAAAEVAGLFALLVAACTQVAAATYNPFIYYRF